jgi:hypothetical protein
MCRSSAKGSNLFKKSKHRANGENYALDSAFMNEATSLRFDKSDRV